MPLSPAVFCRLLRPLPGAATPAVRTPLLLVDAMRLPSEDLPPLDDGEVVENGDAAAGYREFRIIGPLGDKAIGGFWLDERHLRAEHVEFLHHILADVRTDYRAGRGPAVNERGTPRPIQRPRLMP